MKIEKHYFGDTETHKRVDLFILSNANGVAVKLMTYGGRIIELHAPDRSGQSGNIVLGFDNLAPYLQKNPYFGATIGRVANRISQGRFTIDHKPYYPSVNEGANTLHGGLIGFDGRVWSADEVDTLGNRSLRLQYFSPDGEEGFPGNLRVSTTYTLLDNNELRIDYMATTDLATTVNLTNHSYFNLKGPGNDTILDHRLTIYADQYTPTNESQIPTGQIVKVAGTPLDFTTPHVIGERIAQVPGGYDHNYVLNGPPHQMKRAARVEEQSTGRALEIETTQPGIQFYSGNRLDGKLTGIGGVYHKHAGLCLEPQHFPDSVNHPNFPSTVVRSDQGYQETAVYRFLTF